MCEADTVRVFVDFCGTMIKQLHTHVINHYKGLGVISWYKIVDKLAGLFEATII